MLHSINWRLYPFVKVLPALITGLLIGHSFEADIVLLFIPATILFFGGIYWSYLLRKSWLISVVLHVSLLLAGVLLGTADKTATINSPLNYSGVATIITAISEKERSYKTTIELDEHKSKRPIRALLYIRKDKSSAALLPGDKIYLDAEFQLIPSPDIKGQFNYAAYMLRRKISHSAFVDSTKWSNNLAVDRQFALVRIAAKWRQHLEQVIHRHVSIQEAGLVKAMVLGVRDDLDSEVRVAFSRSGIMHILAVSGLHVSIIWMIVSLVHRPLSSWFRFLKTPSILLEVVVVWSFAILTGFGPSVQRAAFMFSLLSLSKIGGMKGQIINITTASAILLLILKPSHLYEAGFQLSYAAVFGILLFYRPIHKVLYFKHRLLQYLWSLEVVSFSAVIGTAPLSVLYFQQFPLVFPISNIIAVPSAFAIVASTVALFVFDRFPFINVCLGFVLSQTVGMISESGKYLSSFQYSALTSLYIDRAELYMLYALIALILLFIYRRLALRMIIPMFLTWMVVFFAYRAWKISEIYSSNDVYTPHESTLIVNVGKKQIVLYDESAIDHFHFPLSGNQRTDRIRIIDSLLIDENELRELNLSLQRIGKNEWADY